MAEPPKPVTGYPAVQPHFAVAGPGYPNAGAGYPNAGAGYPNPPPHPPYYPNPYPAQPASTSSFYPHHRTTLLLRRLIAVIVAVFLIVGAVTLILWLVLRPQLPDFSVHSAVISPFNVTGDQLTADFDFNVSVQNPNKKMGIYYDKIQATVFYGSVFLATAPLEPLFQARRNQTALRVKLATLSQFVEDGKGAEMAADRRGGEVDFRLRLVAWVRFKAGGWRTREHLMRVYCGDVKIGWNGNNGNSTVMGVGSLLGQSGCDVAL